MGKKSRNQTYSYDRSVDGASFILRSATAINASNLGTKQNSASTKGGESGSISCASNPAREGETPAFGAHHPIHATTHYFQTNSPDCLPLPNKVANTSYSSSSQADRHFLSGPLISTMSYDNFVGPASCHAAATEHSTGASFNSLEMGEAFIAGPAPHPFIQTPPPAYPGDTTQPNEMNPLTQANIRALDSATALSRTRANQSQEPSNSVPVRASIEHSEHSTGAASDFSSRVSSDFDRGHSVVQSEHHQGNSAQVARLESRALCETPSYLRHYNRFNDHNYQPNVNVMDLDNVVNLPVSVASSGQGGFAKTSPAVSRSSSHINSNIPLSRTSHRRSLNSSDDVVQWTDRSGPSGVAQQTTRSNTPHA